MNVGDRVRLGGRGRVHVVAVVDGDVSLLECLRERAERNGRDLDDAAWYFTESLVPVDDGVSCDACRRMPGGPPVTCADCRWSHVRIMPAEDTAPDEAALECRRWPPTVVPAVLMPDAAGDGVTVFGVTTQWPDVEGGDWCGEFEAPDGL